MTYTYNNKDITNSQFTDSNGIQYPSNWCANSTQNERDALGVITINEVHPTLLSTEKEDGTFTDVTVGLVTTRTYNKTNLSNAELNAPIIEQIRVIEEGQARAVREVALGLTGSVARLQAIDDSISALRLTLL